MKLFELVGVKKHFKLTLDELVKAFETLSGYKYLGRGNFGYVFKHPSKNEAIKFWVQDSGYERYLNYCLQHQNNPTLPRIFTPVKSLSTFHTRFNKFPEKIKYVRVELLKSVHDDDVKSVLGPLTADSTMVIHKLTLIFLGHKAIKPSDHDRYEKLSVREQQVWETLLGYWKDRKIPEQLIKLYETALAVEAALHDKDYFDVHSENIMVRPGTRELVLSDPIANADDVDVMQELEAGDLLPASAFVTGRAK